MSDLEETLKKVASSRRKRRRREVLVQYSDEIFSAIQQGYSLTLIYEALKIQLQENGDQPCSRETLRRFVKEQRPDLLSKFITPKKVAQSSASKKMAAPSELPDLQVKGQSKGEEQPSDKTSLQDAEGKSSNAEEANVYEPGIQDGNSQLKDQKKPVEDEQPNLLKTVPGQVRKTPWSERSEEERNAEILEDLTRLENPLQYMNGGSNHE